MYYVYLVLCADQTLYTGITTDVERRVKEHNNAVQGAKYTRARRPVRIIYTKEFSNRAQASVEEARIKRLPRVKKLAMINAC